MCKYGDRDQGRTNLGHLEKQSFYFEKVISSEIRKMWWHRDHSHQSSEKTRLD